MKRPAIILIALLAMPAFSEDSPLVAAAKKTNRAKPKSVVITNVTVKTSTGRITTTNNSHIPVIPEPAPSAEVKLNQERDKAKVEAAKKAAEEVEKEKQRQLEMAKAAARMEQGEYGSDADEIVPPPAKP